MSNATQRTRLAAPKGVRLNRALEYVASALGVFGAGWLATGMAHPVVAWTAWTASNVAFIAWALRRRLGGVAAMNATYLVISIIGATNSLR